MKKGPVYTAVRDSFHQEKTRSIVHHPAEPLQARQTGIKKAAKMKDNHVWRPGERVVSTIYNTPYCGKPARILRYSHALSCADKDTFLVFELEEDGTEFIAPVLCLESLEERPEENYKPEENPVLRKSFPELFDSSGNVIERKRRQFYGY